MKSSRMSQTPYITEPRRIVTVGWRPYVWLIAAVLFLLAALWRISNPAVWWDEGWTLAVARTWVEQGIYARLNMGQLIPSGLEAAFPTTTSVALSFRLFGVGLWQGRLPGVLYTLGVVVTMFYLARNLYSRRVAIATLFVLLLMAPQPDLNALTVGRQVMAEVPMLFFLIAGYACLLLALKRSLWFLPLAICCWGIGVVTKAQPFPFWLASMLAPLVVMLLRRRWKLTTVLSACLVGTLAVRRWLPRLFELALGARLLPRTQLDGLYDVTAFVPVLRYRLLAVQIFLLVALPTLLGLAYASWQWLKQARQTCEDVQLEVVRLALLAFAGSWCAWFVLLSLGVPRYLFPGMFVSSIFVAALLCRLTADFNLPATLQRATLILKPRQINRQSLGAWLAIVLVTMTVPPTLNTLVFSYERNDQATIRQVVDYLHAHTASDALIETYHAELFFLLDRPYHYPPDQYHVDLMLRTVRNKPLPRPYDPTTANPDYLVADITANDWKAYDPAIVAKSFRLVQQSGRYGIYERLR